MPEGSGACGARCGPAAPARAGGPRTAAWAVGAAPHEPHPPTHLMGKAPPGASARGRGTEGKTQLPVAELVRGTRLSNQTPVSVQSGELRPAEAALYANHHMHRQEREQPPPWLRRAEAPAHHMDMPTGIACLQA